jgi:hypothetical protein
MADFVTKFSYDTWDTVFDSSGSDSKFNCFLNTHLRIFYSSFPLMMVKNGTKNKTWMAISIKASCKSKRELYFTSRNTNDLR